MMAAAGVSAPEATVCALIEDIFGALGFTDAERGVLTEVLLEASRAGYHSHGVMRIPTFAEDTRAGLIAPAVAPVVVHETAAAAMIDARHCLGPVSAVFAVEHATAKAQSVGIGCAAVQGGNDIARLGAYVGGPARNGLITLPPGQRCRRRRLCRALRQCRALPQHQPAGLRHPA